ncbi:hypothetical protein ACTFIR_005553 [Dictyostelium discoideum]
MENNLLIIGLSAGVGAAVTYLTSSLSAKKKKRSLNGDGDGDDDNNSSPSNQHIDKSIKMDTDEVFTTTATTTNKKESLNLDSLLQEEIFNEQMDRTKLYYGEEGFEKIRESFVVVVGLGGVGGAAAHVLLRSGVKKLRLIDPDLVTLSSLNRNALATRNDVGRSKVEVMKQHFHDICPEVEVEAIQTFFTGELAPKLLHGKPDYVLDCIDNTQTKVELLTYCKRENLRVISSFGAGSSSDPTKVHISDISYTFGCPFGREVRRMLKLNGIQDGILCVYSTEVHRKKLIPLTEDELKLLNEQAVKPTLRVRTLGVSMPIPLIFGTAMSCNVLNDIVGIKTILEEDKRTPPPLTEYTRLFKLLVKKDLIMHRTPPTHLKKFMGPLDIRYIIDEIYEKKSGISGQQSSVLIVIRWRPEKPCAPNNLIYLSQAEAEIHEKVTNIDQHYPKEVVERIDKLLSTVVMDEKQITLANSIL